MKKIKTRKKTISGTQLTQYAPVPDYYNSGIKLFENREYDEAIEMFQRALEHNPELVHAYNYMGNACQEKKLFDQAINCYQKALQINPDDPTAYINLGIACQNTRQHEQAIQNFKTALKLNPDLYQAYDYMGLSFTIENRIDEAIESYERSLSINPTSVMTLLNLGNTLVRQGLLNEAEEYYRRALTIRPNYINLAEALIFTMIYNPRQDGEAIFSEHVKFSDRFAKPLSALIMPHMNERKVSRKLRIGYVSPDFRRHSVAYFIEAVLAAHSGNNFEVFCYSNADTYDEVTERIKTYADQWRDIRMLTDKNAAELVRNDGIDVLIDLAGHTDNNRILLFALKPAPLQVTWIGYPATTGLSTIDYKIVDHYTDPINMTERFYTEKLMRLPQCFLCYLPDKESPEINVLPATINGYITFGSFNAFSKTSPQTLELWAEILSCVPKSRIIMKAPAFSYRKTYDHTIDIFQRRGIDVQRIELLPWAPVFDNHLAQYHRVDIGLDTFPYNGTTTTCEALWMGVPVITVEGDTHVSRVGVSLLSNVGLPELIAKTSGEYISKAVNLAGDLERLKSLRGNLRKIMYRSPLCDAESFTANLENSYRSMWEAWCRIDAIS